VYQLEYHTRPNGNQPVADWLDNLSPNNSAVVMSKLDKLRQVGLELLKTGMMKRIKHIQHVDDLYEVIGGQGRVLVYYERQDNKFIMLHGFLKKRRNKSGG
jgi:phage-related protein